MLSSCSVDFLAANLLIVVRVGIGQVAHVMVKRAERTSIWTTNKDFIRLETSQISI